MPYKENEENLRCTREYHKRRRDVRIAFLHEYKMERGCKLCGYKKCGSSLHFHHNGDKDERIAQKFRDANWELLLKEIAKCDVLCANCHGELHRADGWKNVPYRKDK